MSDATPLLPFTMVGDADSLCDDGTCRLPGGRSDHAAAPGEPSAGPPETSSGATTAGPRR